MAYEKLNINEYVYVKLTDLGREVIRRQGLPAVEENEHGWSRWQLRKLMEMFGKLLRQLRARPSSRCDLPFEIEIRVDC